MYEYSKSCSCHNRKLFIKYTHEDYLLTKFKVPKIPFDQIKKHPLTARIPWNIVILAFDYKISEEDLHFIQKPFAQLVRQDLPKGNHKVCACLLIYYPSISAEEFLGFYNQHLTQVSREFLYQLCAAMGRLDILKKIPIEKAPIRDSFELAAENGHITILEFLSQQWNEPFGWLISNNLLYAIAGNNHPEVLDWINNTYPYVKKAFFSSDIYSRLGCIIQNGAIQSLEWLKANAPSFYEFERILSANEQSFSIAHKYGKKDICMWILMQHSPKMFAFAEKESEFIELVNTYVQYILDVLHQEKWIQSIETARADIDDAPMIYMHLAKNLVRRHVNYELGFVLSMRSDLIARHLIDWEPILEIALESENEEAYTLLRAKGKSPGLARLDERRAHTFFGKASDVAKDEALKNNNGPAMQ